MHGNIQLPMPEADMIIHAGDFSGRGGKEEILNFLFWLNSLPYKHKVFIAGNHDLRMDPSHYLHDIDWFRKTMSLYPSLIYLQGDTVEVEGIKIFGSPVTPSFGRGWAFNADRGAEIDWEWAKIPDDIDIAVTHGPPYGYGDKVAWDGRVVGCKDLLRKLEEVKPKIHVFGHIHEGYGVYKNDNTMFINASMVDEHYYYVNKPVIIDWESMTQVY